MNNVDYSEEFLAILSLCTGIRGLDRGIERVTGPLRTICYVEIEAALIENLVVGMEAGKLAPAPIWTNAKTVPWRYFRGKIFLLLGGYPCQPFSNAGKRKGVNDPRHLWPHFESGIRTTRPICCFFENVLGHLTLGFKEVIDSLRSMGYAVEAGVYTAAEVGAPHKRARVFILAILANAKDHVRGLYERRWRSGSATFDIAGTGEAMGHAEGIDQWREWQSSQGGAEQAGRPGSTMADPKGLPERESTNQSHAITISGKTWTESGHDGKVVANTDSSERKSFGPGGCGSKQDDICERSEKAIGFKECGKSLSDAERQGLALGQKQPAREEQPTSQRGSHIDRWPAGPGRPQHEWECSRTIESSLGCTADGYNFREDLLRALGNGVVEQTAELAFRDLLRKHFA